MSETAEGGAPPELPPDLAELSHLADAAEAQIAGATAVPAAPGHEPGAAAAPAVDETAEVAAMLSLASMVVGKASPAIGRAYDPQACQSIATQYMRCAEAYGWTWHRQASSPVVGLVAAAAMPAVLAWDDIKAEIEARRAARQAASTRPPLPVSSADAPPAPTTITGPHAGQRL